MDPLWHSVSSNLLEHIDVLQSGFYNPNRPNHARFLGDKTDKAAQSETCVS
ncbi:MAG: hypothetical protein OXH22_10160 [Chloroflexi bacterium]|nr:hypothetical protein [Chloroflexota bacterium]